MSDPSARRCALPECQEIIEEIPGRPFRKYCCAAHRAAARKLRLEQSYQEEPGVPTDFSNVDDTAPVPAVPTQAAPPQPDLLPSPDQDQDQDYLPAAFIAQPWEPTQAWEPTGSKKQNAPNGGGNGNGKSGKSNGGKGKSKDVPEESQSPRFSEWLPSLPEYTPPPASDATAAASRRKRKEAAALARKRAVAVLGAFGILAGGGSWVVTNQTAPVAQAPQAAGPRSDTPKIDPAAWAVQAREALGSVNQQLQLIAQTEQLWNDAATVAGATVLPTEMRALQARKADLAQKQALLQSQLDAYQSMGTTSADLAAAQQRLASLDEALRAMPAGPTSPQQQAARDQLVQQRAQAQDVLDAKQQQLSTLRGGVDKAVRSPMPDTRPDHTRSVVQSVVDLAQGKPKPEDQAQRDSALALGAPRDQGSPERQETSNAAPPNPRGAEDGLVSPPSRSGGGPVRDTVGGVNRTVRDVGGGTVREVGDTARDTGGSVRDAVDDVTEPIRGGRSRNSGDSGDDDGGSSYDDSYDDRSRGQSDRERNEDDALPTDEVGDQLTDEQELQQTQDALKLVSRISERLRPNREPEQHPDGTVPEQQPDGVQPEQGPEQHPDGMLPERQPDGVQPRQSPRQRPDTSLPTRPDASAPEEAPQPPQVRRATQDTTGTDESTAEGAGRQGTGEIQTVTARRPSGQTNSTRGGATESDQPTRSDSVGQSNPSRPSPQTAESDDESPSPQTSYVGTGRAFAGGGSSGAQRAGGEDSVRHASDQETDSSDDDDNPRGGVAQAAWAGGGGSAIREHVRSQVNNALQRHRPDLDRAKKYQQTAKNAVDRAQRTVRAATQEHDFDRGERLRKTSTQVRSEIKNKLRSRGESGGHSFFSRSGNGDGDSSSEGRSYRKSGKSQIGKTISEAIRKSGDSRGARQKQKNGGNGKADRGKGDNGNGGNSRGGNGRSGGGSNGGSGNGGGGNGGGGGED